MELTGKLIDCSVDILSGKLKVTFEVEEKNELMKRFDELKNKVLSIKVGLKKKKRSKNANAYMWQLCNKIAQALSKDGDYIYTKEEIYRKAIREVGKFKDYPFAEVDKTLAYGWSKIGIGYFTEELEVGYRMYYGSSSYDVPQMSRLIDYVVQDAKALGIETMTPEDLSKLKAEWEKQYVR